MKVFSWQILLVYVCCLMQCFLDSKIIKSLKENNLIRKIFKTWYWGRRIQEFHYEGQRKVGLCSFLAIRSLLLFFTYYPFNNMRYLFSIGENNNDGKYVCGILIITFNKQPKVSFWFFASIMAEFVLHLQIPLPTFFFFRFFVKSYTILPSLK